MKLFHRLTATAIALAATVLALPATAQQPVDEEYTALIREFTTETFFSTPLVDHLPSARRCPLPSTTSATSPARPTS